MPLRPPLRIVQSKQNPRLKELRRVFGQPPRASETGAHGAAASLIAIEGPNLIGEALRAGLVFQTLFVAEDSEKLLSQLGRGFPELIHIESLLLPREILNSALATEAPQPIAALVRAPAWDWDSFVGDGPILILAALQDPGNLGTILRSAEAFGAAGIIALTGTVSPWNPKALRASAGSAFRIPFVAANAREAFGYLRRSGRNVFATAVEGAIPVTEADLTSPCAIVIGNEGHGVPRDIAAMADSALTIPTGTVESLNAAIAAGILLYEAARQRTSQSQPARPASKNPSASKKRSSP